MGANDCAACNAMAMERANKKIAVRTSLHVQKEIKLIISLSVIEGLVTLAPRRMCRALESATSVNLYTESPRNEKATNS